MDDFLSPVGSRHPNQQIADNGKTPPQGVQQPEEDEMPEGAMEIPLPSKGVFYYPPFRGIKSIWCRPLDWRDEDVLTTKAYIDDGTVFDKIVERVILTKGFSAKKLVPIDRDTILLWLRTQAIGPKMTVDYECPACGAKNSASWNLAALELPEFDPNVYEALEQNGEYRVELPMSGLFVYIKIPLIEESKDTERRLQKKKENEKIEYDMFGTAAVNLIVSGVEQPQEDGTVKVIRNKNEVINYFNKKRLSILDSRYIRKMAEKLALKYNTAQDLVCANEKCNHVQEGVELPIVHPNFFWPDIEP